MPITRRLPKRGFNNIFAKKFAIVNVDALNAFDNGAVVSATELLEKKIIRKAEDGLRVLGSGELTKKLTVKANAFSESAKAKIEAAGGKVEVV